MCAVIIILAGFVLTPVAAVVPADGSAARAPLTAWTRGVEPEGHLPPLRQVRSRR